VGAVGALDLDVQAHCSWRFAWARVRVAIHAVEDLPDGIEIAVERVGGEESQNQAFHGAPPLMLATISVHLGGALNNPAPIAQNFRLGSNWEELEPSISGPLLSPNADVRADVPV
jgi:hypothetical protein